MDLLSSNTDLPDLDIDQPYVNIDHIDFSIDYPSSSLIVRVLILQHAPGVPKILVGNRCHLAFRRQVSEDEAEEYALKHDMTFFEVSPLCDFNVTESLVELARVALKRNGMSHIWGPMKG